MDSREAALTEFKLFSKLPQTLTQNEVEVSIKPAVSGAVIIPVKSPVLRLGNVSVDVEENRFSPLGFSVKVMMDLDSIKVVSNTISEHDKTHIEEKVKSDVLNASSDHKIICNFDQAVEIQGVNGSGIFLRGTLALNGVVQKLEIPFTLNRRGKIKTLHAQFTVSHSDFHLHLISAFAGALKVRDGIKIDISVKLLDLE